MNCGAHRHITDTTWEDGKSRYCQRPKGHTGRHFAHYCGRRRFWQQEPEIDGKKGIDKGKGGVLSNTQIA